MTHSLDVQLRRALPIVLAALLGACGLSKPYPAKQLYALEVPPPAGPASEPGETVLRVQPVRMTEPYGSDEFHYRVGAARFETDYYANFVDEPGRLITAELIEWLASTGSYQAVVGASSIVETKRSLQVVINEFYGDARTGKLEQAVVAARVFLLDESTADTKVLFTRDYRAAEPVHANGHGDGDDALVAAWGAALAKLFEQMAADIRAVP